MSDGLSGDAGEDAAPDAAEAGRRTPLVEICVDDVGGVAAARRGGADRVELCASLSEGGTTPTVGLLRHAAAEAGPMGLQVLVRPRGGDFVHTPAEVEVMLTDIAATRSALGNDERLGFTLGTLTASGDIDERAVAHLVEACGPCPVVFHKGFDTALATGSSSGGLIDRLVDLGVSGVLTSGGDGLAREHLDVLAALVRTAGDRLRIVVAGGVRTANVALVLSATGCREIHLRAAMAVGSASTVVSGGYDTGSRTVTSQRVVTEVVAAALAQAQASGRRSRVQ